MIRIELRLCLLERTLQPLSLDVALLKREIASSFGPHDGVSPTTKRTRTNGFSLLTLARDVRLPLSLTLLNVDDILHVRAHVLLRYALLRSPRLTHRLLRLLRLLRPSGRSYQLLLLPLLLLLLLLLFAKLPHSLRQLRQLLGLHLLLRLLQLLISRLLRLLSLLRLGLLRPGLLRLLP